ncbi:hypothetical protein OF83DRAFT_1165293 [Amylostereum chailletii]|nr:hypothetical protein OF83DRAFT_1165293 [Amylostereum chailletii]
MASAHFCSECNNLLYSKADPDRRLMVYACRINHNEIGENSCMYKNDLLTVTYAVFFQSKREETRMIPVYTKCHHNSMYPSAAPHGAIPEDVETAR